MMRLLGLDPGLNRTGWGVIEAEANRLVYVADGVVESDAGRPLAARLATLYDGILRVIAEFRPEEAAVEETFVNANGQSTLKLGHARGIALLAPAQSGLLVAEYAARLVKKSVVGTGRAEKSQVAHMVRCLLPGARIAGADAADALAVAICHAHHRRLQVVLAEAGARSRIRAAAGTPT
jgi:crossover junction endodeoxyribonuclease RuvC